MSCSTTNNATSVTLNIAIIGNHVGAIGDGPLYSALYLRRVVVIIILRYI